MTVIKKESSEIDQLVTPGDGVYPWGTQITLRDENAVEVGFDSCNVGDDVTATAKLTVVSKDMRESGSGESRTIEFQVVEINVNKPDNSREKTLYGDE